jgi:hypothetical protein
MLHLRSLIGESQVVRGTLDEVDILRSLAKPALVNCRNQAITLIDPALHSP